LFTTAALRVLIDVGVNLGGGQVDVPQQRLDVHPLGPGVQQIVGVSIAQLVGADLLVDPGFLQHPPPVGPRRSSGCGIRRADRVRQQPVCGRRAVVICDFQATL